MTTPIYNEMATADPNAVRTLRDTKSFFDLIALRRKLIVETTREEFVWMHTTRTTKTPTLS